METDTTQHADGEIKRKITNNETNKHSENENNQTNKTDKSTTSKHNK